MKESESRSFMSNSLWPHWLYSPWNSPGQNTGVGSLSLLQGIFPTQGLNPGLPHAGGFFTSWTTRAAQEYWNLSLLQWIFPTQESNRGLLHCRQILYQLSYQGSPQLKETKDKEKILKLENTHNALTIENYSGLIRSKVKRTWCEIFKMLQERNIDLEQDYSSEIKEI